METIIPTVGVVVLNEDSVLLVKHTEYSGHITDVYGLPAGRVEAGESMEDVATRELFEETGLKADRDAIIELPRSYKATIERKDGVKTFSFKIFLCRTYSGHLRESRETLPEWVKLSDLGNFKLLDNVAEAIKQAQSVI